MDLSKGFISIEINPGVLYEHDDGNFSTLISGFTKESTVLLPNEYTHFGIVVVGNVRLITPDRQRILEAGDFFSIVGKVTIESDGVGIVNSAKNFIGLNVFGGPIEPEGRLRYIDGCTDTLLIPPIMKGDPCLNLLHFPEKITQTPHTHPSVRTGVIYRGSGECIIPEENKVIPLITGHAFVIKTGTTHSFNTQEEFMDVIAFHPDSDVGMTDDDHPMINRTIIEGASAKFKKEIRTNEKLIRS